MHKALLLAAITSLATGLGGFLAVKIRDRTHIILGLAAGLMLGLVFFDLLPTIFVNNSSTFGGSSLRWFNDCPRVFNSAHLRALVCNPRTL